MRIKRCKHFPPKGYKALTFGQTVYVRKSATMRPKDWRHEKIHIAQYKEMGKLYFLLIYCWDYIRLLLRYQSNHKAYRGIRLEREAYQNENNKLYLDYREKNAWKKYKI